MTNRPCGFGAGSRPRVTDTILSGIVVLEPPVIGNVTSAGTSILLTLNTTPAGNIGSAGGVTAFPSCPISMKMSADQNAARPDATLNRNTGTDASFFTVAVWYSNVPHS